MSHSLISGNWSYESQHRYSLLNLVHCMDSWSYGEQCPIMLHYLHRTDPAHRVVPWKNILHWGGDPCWHHAEDAQVYIKIQAAVKGEVGDLVQKNFFYACWKSLHISIALIKLSGLNVFISSVEGIGPKQLLPEHYDRLSCLPVKYVFAHFCAPCLHRHDMSSACSSENERRNHCNIMHCVQ